MSWKKPESEEAWREALSAHVDGELDGEERRGLEACLEQDPQRAAQFDELRRLSQILKESAVGAIEPDEAFVRRWSRAAAGARGRGSGAGAARPKASVNSIALRMTQYAAILCAGVFIGVFGSGFLRDSSEEKKPTAAKPASPVEIKVVADSRGISERQAKYLLRESEADNLKSQVLENLERNDWRAALSAGWQLGREYSDTLGLDDLPKEELLRLLQKKYPMIGRI